MDVHYDGTGWNADYMATLNEAEFVEQFGSIYSHVEDKDRRIRALKTAYQFIVGEYRKAHPEYEKPA